MKETLEICTSPPFRGEKDGEAGLCDLPGIPTSPRPSPPPKAERKGMSSRSRHRLALTLTAGLLVWGPAGAAEPNAVGIIMKVTGETDPELPLREEVSANTVIKLGPGAELTFLHYPPTCGSSR